MSLESSHTVDAIGIENATGCIVLTVADSWDWSDERTHLSALQDKLNAYLEFIETGQVWESFPPEQERKLVIDVITRFPLPESGEELLRKAADVASQLQVLVRHRTYEGIAGIGPTSKSPALPDEQN